ncbi:MAG: D-alanyl-D-alanine carboxypeptidase/D-alanyl-D-alanine-endopeptidase, partial [Pyrinomonadaceae bacterium]|nr:D-alanyl-D-alanine carboxypeptidase/D-alanyl-D-alanine-endopeptidase [Pyrinomonadaceae bacterium]
MNKKAHSTGRVLLISGAIALSLIILSLIFFQRQINGRAQPENVPAREQTSGSEANNRAQPPASFVLSDAPADRELRSRIDGLIDSSSLNSARWGLFIMSVRDGRVLHARDAGYGFTPASNMKVYTTAIALDLLGASYRWRTSLYSATAPEPDGTINGDLILYGRGQPDMAIENKDGQHKSSLGVLADELYRRGVRRVRGNVIGDESYFRGEPLGNGWLWNDVQWYFGAEPSALTVGGNEVTLNIAPAAKPGEPARIKLEPETDYVRLVNETMSVERGQPATIGINRGLSDNVVRVWGDFPLGGRGFNARLSVHQPALWAARLLREELRVRGIAVEGEARVRNARDTSERERFNPQSAVELASTNGQTLGEIASAVNKESLNLESELMLRTLGKEKGATAPDADARKMLTRGDDEAGLAVIRKWLDNSGVPARNLSLHDGSGLSRLNLVTPEATGRLLAAMTKSPAAGIFRDSLPVAGRDGTLRSRLRAASERIVAKTGTLTYTSSLSGYAVTGDGELLAFSIMCNNEATPNSSSIPIIDAIALLLTT